MTLSLNAFKTLGTAVAVSAVITIGANSAQALTFSFGGNSVPGQGLFSNQPRTITIDFDNPLPAGVSLSGGAIVSGSLENQYEAPADDATNYLTLGGTVPSAPSPVVLTFTTLLDYFGIYWGSIDTYNTIKFFNDTTEVDSFTGTEIGVALGLGTDPANGNYGVDRYVNFSGELFNKVELSSSTAAFEADNIAFKPIPTPALLPGLVALGTAAWRKRNQKVVSD